LGGDDSVSVAAEEEHAAARTQLEVKAHASQLPQRRRDKRGMRG
jgi:hypothetical protein